MIDPVIIPLVGELKANIVRINELIVELRNKNVDVRIAFKDSTNGGGSMPHLELWRCEGRDDYL